MGLIKAAITADKSTLADQWLEFVTLDNADEDTLVKRGSVKKSGNNKGTSGVISNGSRIVVPTGYTMMIVDNGKVMEFCAEPGEYVYDKGTEPSFFYGGFGKNIVGSIKQFGDRFKFAGDAPKDTRVYYINTRIIEGLKFGTAQPVPFDDPKYQSIDIRYFGMYSVRVSDPVILIDNLIGANQKDEVKISKYTDSLKSEFVMSLTTAMVKLAYEKNISYNKLPLFQEELGKFMNEKMDNSWTETRGLEIINVGLESVSVDEKTKERISDYDKMYFAEQHAKGMTIAATAEAMKAAASNEGGNAGMFMGMNAGNMFSGAMQSGSNVAFNQEPENPGIMRTQPLDLVEPNENVWVCVCGTENSGNFCSECGKKKPEKNKTGWLCECGQENLGNFCSNCGKPKVVITNNICPNCGANVSGKFCPECGHKL